MNWRVWVKGLAAVAIGGAAAGTASALGNVQSKGTAFTAGIGALSTVIAYLLKSPLPGSSPVVPESTNSSEISK